MIIFYQIVMLILFMTGYSAIPNNMPNLTISIVNDDKPMGAEFTKQFSAQLPFHVITNHSLERAQSDLEERNIHMIIHIPSDFSKKMSSNQEQAKLEFFINASNPSSISSGMANVSTRISNQISAQIQTQSFEGLLQSLNIPADQAKQSVESIMNKVSSNVITTNPQPAGMSNQMVPMFLSMCMYVGAMIYSMQSIAALTQIREAQSKWKAFLSLQGVNLIIAVIAPLIGVTIIFAVHSYDTQTYFKTWWVHALELFTAMEFTSIPVMLLGQAGMILNIPLLLTQTIAGGSVMPREMMLGYFKVFSYFSPLYYSINLDYNVLFGGGKTFEFAICLGLIAICALLINAVIYGLKKVKVPEEITDPTTEALALELK